MWQIWFVIQAGDVNIYVLKGSGVHDGMQNILTEHKIQYLINIRTRVTIESQSSIDNVFTNIDKSQYRV